MNIELTSDETRFIIQALQAVPLSGNIAQLTKITQLVVGIINKLEQSLPKENKK